MITDYHAKYYAHALMRVGGSGVDRLGQALFDAKVDLNPHQIEAALFALRSPLSKGVLLADEVGLGKTIEAGLILCQYWAEQRRHLLIICPASLRKQWALELEEKFNLPVVILEKRSFNDFQSAGKSNPFDNKSVVVITSMHFAARANEYIQQISWDLVVIDEAHKLRNAYRQSNRLGQLIRAATEGRKKVLLTATPLQNSLMELYGLSTLIDEHLFADPPTFRMQYMNGGGDMPALREQLQSFCHRVLRSQVLEYVKYTERKAILQSFMPSEQEHELYEAVSDFLQTGGRFSLPTGQRHLLVLLVRKVLASSPKALAGTLDMIVQRLERLRKAHMDSLPALQRFILDEDFDEDLLESLAESYELREEQTAPYGLARPILPDALDEEDSPDDTPLDLEKLDAEIAQVKRFAEWARSIFADSKLNSLVTALNAGFERMDDIGAARKAVIFTESKRTQVYIKEFLENHGYAGEVVTFNGTNTDSHSAAIHEKWKQKHATTGRASGAKAVDTRTALIDHFRDNASILIATEAAAEGINLQFCSMVINYDLPWNPQRIEQRIGRCHRYGQKHDVVVINFLNERNHADRRVYELLEAKFNLFNGVFGASDEILGTMESGVDFERRVIDIYQQCRTAVEIEKAFSILQAELEETISAKMQETREVLLKHFDEDVHARLRANLDETKVHIDRTGRMFWALSEHELAGRAAFFPQTLSFALNDPPVEGVPVGTYTLISKEQGDAPEGFTYRLNHPLGKFVLEQGKARNCPPGTLTFDISNHSVKISPVEKLKGSSGWLSLQLLRVNSFDTNEYLLFSGIDDSGKSLDQETCEKLFSCSASCNTANPLPPLPQKLTKERERHAEGTVARNLEENMRYFSDAREQLDRWAEAQELAAQKELDDIKRQLRELRRKSRLSVTVDEQLTVQKDITVLERKKRKLRQSIFDVEDEISRKRDTLVNKLEQQMAQRTSVNDLFTIRWRVV